MSTPITPSRQEVPGFREPASPRLRRGLIPEAARRRDYVLVAVLAAAAFAIESVAWPFFAGRDAQSYLVYYLDMGSADPVLPQLMLFRTPLVPLVLGSLLELGSTVPAEIVMGVCYVLSILAVYTAGAFWGRWVGLLSAGALLAYPGYAAIFHTVSPDGLYATGIALWAALICATAVAPTVGRFALHGVVAFLLVMARPAGLALVLAFAVLPLLLAAPWRQRLLRTAAFLASAGVLLLGWSAYNSLRYGDFTVSRLSGALMPLYRLHVVDRLVEPDNGPASRELARAIERGVLVHEPYKAYGIDLDEFLRKGGNTAWADVPPLADRTWGWHDDYGKLREVAREAIVAHPGAYARGVASTVWDQLTSARYEPPASRAPPRSRPFACEACSLNRGSVAIRGRRLPKPRAGQSVPRGYYHWSQSTPDDRIGSDWGSFALPRFRFRDPDDAAHWRRVSAESSEMMSKLPSRDGRSGLANRLNTLDNSLPPMFLWLVVGAAGLAIRRLQLARVLVFLCAIGLVGVVSASLGTGPLVWYRLPFDPLFILFGMAGLISLASALGPKAAAALRRLPGRSNAPAGA